MTQLICNIIMFAACALAVAYYIIAIKHISKITAAPYDSLTAKVSYREYEAKRTAKFHNSWLIMSAGGVLFTVIAAVCCLLDGLTNEGYIGYIVASIFIIAIALAFLFSHIMCTIGVKNQIVLFYNDYSGEHYFYKKFITKYRSGVGDTLITGLFTAIFPAVTAGLTIYTIILLAV